MLDYDTNICPICQEGTITEVGDSLVCSVCGVQDAVAVLGRLLNLPLSIARQVYTKRLYGSPDLPDEPNIACQSYGPGACCVTNVMYTDGSTSNEYPSLFGALDAAGDVIIVDSLDLWHSSPFPNTLIWSSAWLPHWSPMFTSRKVYVLFTAGGPREKESRAVALSLNSAQAEVHLAPFTRWEDLPSIPLYGQFHGSTSVEDAMAADGLKDVIAKFHYQMVNGKLTYRSNLIVPIHQLVEAVIQWLKVKGGKFLWDADSSCGHLIFNGRDYPLLYNSPLLRSFLFTTGGILASTGEGKAIIDGLCSMAEEAEHVVPIPWLTCDPKRKEIYLRQGSTMITVKPGEVVEHPSQSLSFDLIQGDRKWFSPMKLMHLSPEEKIEGLKMLFSAVANFFAVPDVAREIIICWLMSIFLKDFSSIRPGMVITGPASTGKSTMLQLLYWLFYGKNESELPTFPSPAGLWRTGSVEPFLPIDNKNMDGMEEAVRTFLDVSATGGKRIMGVSSTSNHDTKNQKVHSLVMISGLDVPLHHDVRTRYIEIVTDFQHKTEFFPLRDKERVFDNRDFILSAVLQCLAEDVLPNLDQYLNREICRKYRILLDSKERIVDYFMLMVAIGSAFQTLGIIPAGPLDERWPDYINSRADKTDNANARTIEWWKNFKIALIREGIQFTDDVGWKVINRDHKRVGIEGTPEELLNALAWAANVLKRKLPWDSTKALINALKMETKAWLNTGWTLAADEDFEHIRILWGDGI